MRHVAFILALSLGATTSAYAVDIPERRCKPVLQQGYASVQPMRAIPWLLFGSQVGRMSGHGPGIDPKVATGIAVASSVASQVHLSKRCNDQEIADARRAQELELQEAKNDEAIEQAQAERDAMSDVLVDTAEVAATERAARKNWAERARDEREWRENMEAISEEDAYSADQLRQQLNEANAEKARLKRALDRSSARSNELEEQLKEARHEAADYRAAIEEYLEGE